MAEGETSPWGTSPRLDQTSYHSLYSRCFVYMSHHLNILFRARRSLSLSAQCFLLWSSQDSLLHFKASFSTKTSLESSVIWRGQSFMSDHPEPGRNQGPLQLAVWYMVTDSGQELSWFRTLYSGICIPKVVNMFFIFLNVWEGKNPANYFVTLEGTSDNILLFINKVLMIHGSAYSQHIETRHCVA